MFMLFIKDYVVTPFARCYCPFFVAILTSSNMTLMSGQELIEF